MADKRLSIIVPVYKAAQTVCRALDSVYSQLSGELLNSVEIIAVNDASPDNSADVLREYQGVHPSLKILTHVRNLGAAAAQNTGEDGSSGEYFLRLDSDDAMRPGSIRKLLDIIETHKPDIVFYPFHVVDTAGGHVGDTKIIGSGLYHIDDRRPASVEVLFYEIAFGIMTPRVAYRRATAPGLRQEARYPVSEDRYFGWQFFREARTVYVLNDMVVDYYQCPDSLSRSKPSDRAIRGLLELDERFWKEFCAEGRFSHGRRFAFRRLFPALTGWHYDIVFSGGGRVKEHEDLYFRAMEAYLNSLAAYLELGLWPIYLRLAVKLRSRIMVRIYWALHDCLWIRGRRKLSRLIWGRS